MTDPSTFAWFHVTVHTYAAWLHGDPRGFRTRHHREHVEGDYKNPPPKGKYDDLFARSQQLLKQLPVVLSPHWRQLVGEAVRNRLFNLGAEVIAISMSAKHAHIQAKLPPAEAREWVGLAKKHAWFIARNCGWVTKLWAKRSRCERIRDYTHQKNTFEYIVRHRNDGAWVWTFRDGR
jgi:hypothetical protein